MEEKKLTDQSNLPNIPGFRVSIDTRSKFHKTHLFDVRNGIPVTDLARSAVKPSPSDLENQIISKSQTEKENKVSGDHTSRIPMSNLPRWVVFDRKVLRYYSYFKESVFNSPIESERVRKCIIYYYLEDDTIMIDEIKQENSGIPQSGFLKRQRVPKSSNNKAWLHYTDLIVGKTILIYNREFKIIDADESTRKYYAENDNIKLDCALSYPKDDYIKHFEQDAAYRLLSAQNQNNIKAYVEASLGRVSSERLAKAKKIFSK
jgi:hypothetical protein